MKIKICGMREPENIRKILALQPDFIGFIFYEKSQRYISLDDFLQLETNFVGTNKVAVFVNESVKNIIKTATLGNFKYIQLHGNETPEFCEELKYLDFKIIKAFGIDAAFDFEILSEYQSVCDYFLFDTKTKDYGGSGHQFDWDLLNKYILEIPVFLSGGLSETNVTDIQRINKQIPLFALDFNSKLEDAPGLKNIEKAKNIIKLIKHS